ncbi:isochorismatase family cysteine hydrolase [Streptomyces millisiae]|uniref:Isochorismatase family cysteine hydrolase n=1 Tax=Streptomyces millisiae TaxID=3075542 RepID=A0ABU2LNK2_9ACTN|nr:isochorismatase family cysteine hydrolase [Streptomyces sp. DSM 44918]MDT0319161.1 isochorismatase family cysteine hydrolase [Streptomyces sp. DSM 44918]
MSATAILVIDMQNGFVHPDGSVPRAGLGVPGVDAVVDAMVGLVEAARATGLPVVYTRHVYRENAPEMSPRIRAAFAPVLAVDPRMLARGSWDAEVVAELRPEPGDVVVDKSRYDAFLHTDLEPMLRALGVDRLVVGGVLTNYCVESTVRSGVERGFDIAVAADCTAAAARFHGPSLASMEAMFATVGPWRELLPTPWPSASSGASRAAGRKSGGAVPGPRGTIGRRAGG